MKLKFITLIKESFLNRGGLFLTTFALVLFFSQSVFSMDSGRLQESHVLKADLLRIKEELELASYSAGVFQEAMLCGDVKKVEGFIEQGVGKYVNFEEQFGTSDTSELIEKAKKNKEKWDLYWSNWLKKQKNDSTKK